MMEEMSSVYLIWLLRAMVILCLAVIILMRVFVCPILEAIDNYHNNTRGLAIYLTHRSRYSGYFEMSEWQKAHEEYIKQEELWEYCVSAMRRIEEVGHYEVAWFLMNADERKKWTSFLEDFSNTYCALSKAQKKMEERKS